MDEIEGMTMPQIELYCYLARKRAVRNATIGANRVAEALRPYLLALAKGLGLG